MRLITPAAWADKYFAEESRPSETTLRRWVKKKTVTARKIGGTWYIDEDEWLAQGNALVQRFLEAS